MQVWRRALRISCGSYRSKFGFRSDIVAFCQSVGVRIEMRVVISATAGANHGNCSPTQFVLTNPIDITLRGGVDRSAALGKDILPLVPSVATGRLPGIGNLTFRNTRQWHRDMRWWVGSVEPRNSGVKQEVIANEGANSADEADQQN